MTKYIFKKDSIIKDDIEIEVKALYIRLTMEKVYLRYRNEEGELIKETLDYSQVSGFIKFRDYGINFDNHGEMFISIGGVPVQQLGLVTNATYYHVAGNLPRLIIDISLTD